MSDEVTTKGRQSRERRGTKLGSEIISIINFVLYTLKRLRATETLSFLFFQNCVHMQFFLFTFLMPQMPPTNIQLLTPSPLNVQWTFQRSYDIHIKPALNSSFCSLKRLGILPLPPGWDANPSQDYPQHYDRQYPFIHLGEERQCETKFLV